jgi:hypothetical protein
MMIGVPVAQRRFAHVAVDWSCVMRVPACVCAVFLLRLREGGGMEIETQDANV